MCISDSVYSNTDISVIGHSSVIGYLLYQLGLQSNMMSYIWGTGMMKYYNKKEHIPDSSLFFVGSPYIRPPRQHYSKKGPTNLKPKQCLTLLTPIFRLTSMELTQIHDLIIQLFSLLKKKKKKADTWPG